MMLPFFLFLAVIGCAQGTESFRFGDVVYVSKVRGQTKRDRCGSRSLPCKHLQDGIDKLSWGGQLVVDGEHTALDPYMCETSKGKVEITKSISIKSYTMTAHISCVNGILFMPSAPYTMMNVSISGLQLKTTVMSLKNVNATIQDCIFLESSPAIDVMNSQSLQLYSLNIKNSVFERNHGCIKFLQRDSSPTMSMRCSRLVLKLKNVVFKRNIAFTGDVGNSRGGLVFVSHKNCLCKDVSFLSTWYNITATENQRGKTLKRENIVERIPNRNAAKALKNTSQDPILDSLFVVYTCSANITINRVTSDLNKNMRFLGLRCCISNVQIYKSGFHSHVIQGPGGVVYIPDGESTYVIIKKSDFSRNLGSIGGVLQVDGGSKKRAILMFSNVNFLYCSGNTTGCAVSVGNVENRGVDKVFANFQGVLFNRCHNKIKRGTGRFKYGPLCLRATKVTSVIIHNCTFVLNKNRKTAAVNIKHIPTTNRGSTADVQITRTLFDQNACDTYKPTLGIFIEKPTQVNRSRLRIFHSTFVRNHGTVISVDNFKDIKLNNMTCRYSKGLCYQFYIGKRKKLKNTPPGMNASFYIKNSMFSQNYQSFNVKYVQPNFIDIKLRNVTISENTRGNPAFFQFGSRRLENLAITGTVLFEQVKFISNSKDYESKNVHMFAIIVPKRHDGNITFVIRKSVFQNNFHRNTKMKKKNSFELPEKLFFFQTPRNDANNSGNSCSSFPSYDYRNTFIFENVIFENNTGPLHVTYIDNGKTFFVNCLFTNNYSFRPSTAAHLFIQEGIASVEFHNTNFTQTKAKPKFLASRTPNSETSSMLFVFAGARGPLLLINSNFIANDSSERVIPHFVIQTQGYVHIDSKTKLVCPVGSYMDHVDGSHLIKDPERPSINITQRRFICKMCGAGEYSLERGAFQNQTLKPITCHEFCPFGAECAWNVHSRPNFWGYSVIDDPPQLNFTRCPEHYCRVPKKTSNTSVYNRCSGNRTGLMCGACKEGFTESLFNHDCRPVHECRDGWFWVVAGLFSIIIAYYLLCRPPVVFYLRKNLLWFRNKIPSIQHGMDEQTETSDSHGAHGYSKIIFYFYQVADLLMLESSTEILHDHIFISSVVSIYNFKVEVEDSRFGCPFPGLTAVTKELFRSLQVFAVMVFLLVFYFLHWLLWVIRRRPRPHFAPYLAAIIEVLLLGYERLGHTSLKLLNCVALNLSGGEEWRLVLDGNITCWVHWWQFAMIAYNIVFVVPFLLVVLVGTSKLEHRKISALQFMAACFVPFPFLVCWILQRCLKYRSHDGARGARHQNTQAEEKRRALLGVLQGPFRPPDNNSRGASYWESILIGRRLVYLCLYSFVPTPMLRLLLMTTLSVIILVHNVVVRPYKDRKANLFGVAMLSIHVALAIINLCKSVLVTLGVTPKGAIKAQIRGLQLFEVALLGALPVIFLLLILLTLLSQIPRVFVFIRFVFRRSRDELRFLNIISSRDCSRPLLAPVSDKNESLTYSTADEVQEKANDGVQ